MVDATDTAYDLVRSELQKLWRSPGGMSTTSLVAHAPWTCQLLGGGDPAEALGHLLAIQPLGDEDKAIAAAFAVLSRRADESVDQALSDFGHLHHDGRDARTIRRWAERGLDATASAILHLGAQCVPMMRLGVSQPHDGVRDKGLALELSMEIMVPNGYELGLPELFVTGQDSDAMDVDVEQLWEGQLVTAYGTDRERGRHIGRNVRIDFADLDYGAVGVYWPADVTPYFHIRTSLHDVYRRSSIQVQREGVAISWEDTRPLRAAADRELDQIMDELDQLPKDEGEPASLRRMLELFERMMALDDEDRF